jgi:hypothetical protein
MQNLFFEKYFDLQSYLLKNRTCKFFPKKNLIMSAKQATQRATPRNFAASIEFLTPHSRIQKNTAHE